MKAKVTGIVGIDPSLTSLGFARIDIAEIKSGNNFTFRGTFVSNVKRGTQLERCVQMWRDIRIETHNPDLVFIEDYAYGKPHKMAALGELGGILRLMLSRYSAFQLEAIPVAIGSWKKFLCGRGNLNKDEFKLQVYKKFDIECSTNDEAAAIAIADFGAHLVLGQHNRDLTKYEEGAIKQYRKDNPAFLQSLAKLQNNS